MPDISLSEMSVNSLPQMGYAEPLSEDWSSTTQEVLDTLPQTWTRGLLYSIVLFGAIAVPWAMVSKVDEVGTAKGRLEPKGKTIRIDAAVGGTVSSVKVREGQQVKKGQRLLEINSELVQTELRQAQAKLEGLLNRRMQLLAIKSHLELATRTQQQQRQSQTIEQSAMITQARQRLDFHRSSSRLTQSLVNKDQEKAARFRKFKAMGIVPGVQVEEAERVVLESQQRLSQAQSEIEQTASEIAKQQSTYQRILRQADLAILDSQKQLREMQAQLSDLNTEITQTRNQIKSLEFQWKQRVIYVPVEGTLFQLPVQNAGAVIQSGQTIAQLAPKGAPLVLRAQIDSTQSGFLRTGLPVKVKFDAFPFQDYGIVQGYIRWISPDSRVDQSPPQPREVYDVEIQLDQNYIQAVHQKIPLTPGQTATAEVIIRQRYLIDFMLDPFRKLQKSGMSM